MSSVYDSHSFPDKLSVSYTPKGQEKPLTVQVPVVQKTAVAGAALHGADHVEIIVNGKVYLAHRSSIPDFQGEKVLFALAHPDEIKSGDASYQIHLPNQEEKTFLHEAHKVEEGYKKDLADLQKVKDEALKALAKDKLPPEEEAEERGKIEQLFNAEKSGLSNKYEQICKSLLKLALNPEQNMNAKCLVQVLCSDNYPELFRLMAESIKNPQEHGLARTLEKLNVRCDIQHVFGEHVVDAAAVKVLNKRLGFAYTPSEGPVSENVMAVRSQGQDVFVPRSAMPSDFRSQDIIEIIHLPPCPGIEETTVHLLTEKEQSFLHNAATLEKAINGGAVDDIDSEVAELLQSALQGDGASSTVLLRILMGQKNIAEHIRESVAQCLPTEEDQPPRYNEVADLVTKLNDNADAQQVAQWSGKPTRQQQISQSDIKFLNEMVGYKFTNDVRNNEFWKMQYVPVYASNPTAESTPLRYVKTSHFETLSETAVFVEQGGVTISKSRLEQQYRGKVNDIETTYNDNIKLLDNKIKEAQNRWKAIMRAPDGERLHAAELDDIGHEIQACFKQKEQLKKDFRNQCRDLLIGAFTPAEGHSTSSMLNIMFNPDNKNILNQFKQSTDKQTPRNEKTFDSLIREITKYVWDKHHDYIPLGHNVSELVMLNQIFYGKDTLPGDNTPPLPKQSLDDILREGEKENFLMKKEQEKLQKASTPTPIPSQVTVTVNVQPATPQVQASQLRETEMRTTSEAHSRPSSTSENRASLDSFGQSLALARSAFGQPNISEQEKIKHSIEILNLIQNGDPGSRMNMLETLLKGENGDVIIFLKEVFQKDITKLTGPELALNQRLHEFVNFEDVNPIQVQFNCHMALDMKSLSTILPAPFKVLEATAGIKMEEELSAVFVKAKNFGNQVAKAPPNAQEAMKILYTLFAARGLQNVELPDKSFEMDNDINESETLFLDRLVNANPQAVRAFIADIYRKGKEGKPLKDEEKLIFNLCKILIDQENGLSSFNARFQFESWIEDSSKVVDYSVDFDERLKAKNIVSSPRTYWRAQKEQPSLRTETPASRPIAVSQGSNASETKDSIYDQIDEEVRRTGKTALQVANEINLFDGF